MSLALSLPIVISRVATTFLLSRTEVEEIFLFVYLLAFDQSRNARHQRIFCFVLDYVPADSGSTWRCRRKYAPVTMPEVGMCCWWRLRCKWSDAGFVLKLDVEMLLLVDAWEVVISMSPNSNFCQLSVYISSAVSCCRNLQGFSGFALFNLSSKCTFNVQELLTLRGSVRTSSTWFSLNRCVQVSSSSSLSHFQVWCFKSSDLERLDKFSEVLVEF